MTSFRREHQADGAEATRPPARPAEAEERLSAKSPGSRPPKAAALGKTEPPPGFIAGVAPERGIPEGRTDQEGADSLSESVALGGAPLRMDSEASKVWSGAAADTILLVRTDVKGTSMTAPLNNGDLLESGW